MSELHNPPESDDFEWVNTWATGAPAATDAKPPQQPAETSTSASDRATPPAPQETISAAPVRVVAETQGRDVVAARPTDTVAPQPPVTAPPNFAERVVRASRKRTSDADQFVHPATRRFFAALRAPVSLARNETPAAPATTSPELAPEPAPAAAEVHETPSLETPVAPAASEPAMVESAEATLAPEASQLDRDIADIECARDALVDAEPTAIAEPRRIRGRFAALRHAESVPILVGSVVGATLLLVFGAAASLISLR